MCVVTVQVWLVSIASVCCDSTSLAGSYARLSLRQDVTEYDAVMAIYLYEESITSRSGQPYILAVDTEPKVVNME